MARAALVIGNWKMNGSVALTRIMSEALREQQQLTTAVKVVVCPPFTLLAELTRQCFYDNFAVGAQNVNAEPNGAHTGEVSVSMLQELGVEYALIGHSERRAQNAETDAIIAAKVAAATTAGMTAVLCVGENQQQRQQQQTWTVVERQLASACEGLTAEQAAKLVVAYEPVWAIGTGESASPQQAQQVHGQIRQWLVNQFGPIGENREILYGGSVKADNAAELFAQEDIDGGLIGGASLKTEDFVAIIQAAQG